MTDEGGRSDVNSFSSSIRNCSVSSSNIGCISDSSSDGRQVQCSGSRGEGYGEV